MSEIVQTAGRDALGVFAPEFAHYNDDILFGENWNNTDIDIKTRSIITLSVFMGRGLVDSSLKYHLESAKKNGISKTEIAAIITHAAFYAGWPVAWAVFRMAKEVWMSETSQTDDTRGLADKEKYQQDIMFPIGEPNDGYAQYFVGQSYLAPVLTNGIPIYNVTFSPACRNNWHIHHAVSGGGQILICVGGRGWYQEEGKPAEELLPGKIIYIPAETKHWHGAAADSWMSHLAIEVDGIETRNEWCEPVSEEEYAALT